MNASLGAIIGFSILIIILISMSAFYSFSEMAIAYSSRIRIQTMHDETTKSRKKKRLDRVQLLLENTNQSITSIVVLNNIVNVLVTAITSTFLTVLLGTGVGFLISILVMTISIILFGELLPKMLAKKHPESGLLLFATPLVITYYLIYPISLLFKKIIKHDSDSVVKSEQELRQVLEETKNENYITDAEHDFLQKTLLLDETNASSVMVPIKDVVYVNSKVTKSKLLLLISRYKHTRIPVIEGKSIKGVISTKSFLIDIARNKKKFKVDDYMYDVKSFFLEEDIASIFKYLKANRQHMGIISDKDNKPVGIITIEDIIETITGEMYDETDVKKDGIFHISEYIYLVEPNAKIKDLFTKELKLELSNDLSSKTTMNDFFENLSSGESNSISDFFAYKNILIWKKKDRINKDKDIFEIDIIK